MNDRKFSPRAEKALRFSQEAAGELGHGYVGTEHLLLGLTRLGSGPAWGVLAEEGLTYDMVSEIICKSVGAGLPGSNPAQGLTPERGGSWKSLWKTLSAAAAMSSAASTSWPGFSGRAIIWPSVSSVPRALTPGGSMRL